jgi:hypothetical protein
MAITPEDIQAHLEHYAIPYTTENDTFYVVANCKRYRNDNGLHQFHILIHADFEGRQLRMHVPWAYTCTDLERIPKLAEACLQVTSRLTSVNFQLDRNDGELAFSQSMPVMDSHVTAEQFLALLNSLPRAIDLMDPLIRAAINEGKLLSVEVVRQMERDDAEKQAAGRQESGRTEDGDSGDDAPGEEGAEHHLLN